MAAAQLHSGQPISTAQLQWDAEQPRSAQFQDVYRSPDGAIESERVFIEPSNLAPRWLQQDDFTIAELGFGTGLNLAVLLEHWRRQPGTRLHFVSFEAHPLGLADWQRICRLRARELPGYAELRSSYPPAISGWHRRTVLQGTVTLSLFFGDVADGLSDLQQRGTRPINAWWLDGFAPDRNPAMWDPTLLAQLPALSAQGATVATFTVAGRVRRALGEAGFAMQRIDQQPIKRESLAGVLEAPAAVCSHPFTASQQLARSAPIQIVGAGIAGASVARALAEAGRQCIVFDAGAAPMGASTLPAAVMHGRLLADQSHAAAVRLHGQLLASAELERWPGWQASGVLQCASSTADIDKLHRVYDLYGASGNWCAIANQAARQRALGDWLTDTGAALWFPQCGSLNPGRLITWLLSHPRIETRWQQPITEQLPWDGIRIYANGGGVQSVPKARFLELSGLTGQVERLGGIAPPAVPLVGSGYAVPLSHAPGAEQTMTGGNYEYVPWAPDRASLHNRSKAPTEHRWLGRWRGVRITTSDRLPVAGLLVDQDHQPIHNRLVSVGHGSQGMTSSFLAAASITSLLTGSPPALDKAMSESLAPLRFRQRQARRGYRFGASH